MAGSDNASALTPTAPADTDAAALADDDASGAAGPDETAAPSLATGTTDPEPPAPHQNTPPTARRRKRPPRGLKPWPDGVLRGGFLRQVSKVPPLAYRKWIHIESWE
ncbi:hypothetical protein ADENT20671_2115 [Actinomyces denticolens]|nr:hypothetical protein ADENT20671_2115 [Actinomyces denticolens]